jgi:hypothetical protein
MIKFCANIDQIIKIMKITNSDLKCLLSPLYIIPKNTDRGMPSFGIVYPRMEQSLRLYMNGFEKSFSLSLYIIYKIWGCIRMMEFKKYYLYDLHEANIFFNIKGSVPDFKFIDYCGDEKNKMENCRKMCGLSKRLLEMSVNETNNIIEFFEDRENSTNKKELDDITTSTLFVRLNNAFMNIENDWIDNYELLKRDKYDLLWNEIDKYE